LRPRIAGPADRARAAGWLTGAGVAAAFATSLPELVPLGSPPVYVVIVLAHVAPFFCAALALDGAGRGDGRLRAAGAGGIVAGVLLATPCLDAGGAHRASWACALLLAAGGVAAGGRRGLAWRGAAGAAVLVAASFSAPGAGLPRRVHDPDALLKPYFDEVAPGGRASILATVWSADGRTDEIAFGGAGAPLRWIFTDGTAPVPISAGAADLEAWKRRFPLLALPFAALDPADALVLGSVPGAESEAAARFSLARVRFAAYDRNATRLSSLPAGAGGDTDARRALRAARGSLDLVLFASSHTTRSVRLHANVRDARLWTREAFAEARASLRPDGAIAIVTSDERLFARACLTAADDGAPLARRAWGFRVGGEATSSPHRFLLLARNEPPSAEIAERVRAASAAWPVEPLFGPGFLPEPSYGALAAGSDGSAEALAVAFSRRAGAWLDLGPATDEHPRFFDIARDAHPWTRWLVAACLGPLLVVLLVPLGDERRRDARESGVPVVARIAELAILGVSLAFVLAAITQRVPFATGVPFPREPAALAGLAAGWAIGWARFVRGGTARAPALAGAAALAAAAMVGWGEAWVVAAAGSAWARQLVAAGVCVGLGAAGAASCCFTTQRLESERPTAARWAWIAFGVAAAGGIALAAWLVHARGWGLVGGSIVAVHVVPLGLAAWSRAAGRSAVRANG
jgi:hypothetical protein